MDWISRVFLMNYYFNTLLYRSICLRDSGGPYGFNSHLNCQGHAVIVFRRNFKTPDSYRNLENRLRSVDEPSRTIRGKGDSLCSPNVNQPRTTTAKQVRVQKKAVFFQKQLSRESRANETAKRTRWIPAGTERITVSNVDVVLSIRILKRRRICPPPGNCVNAEL